ncbi:MAG: hypothetical protein KME26_30400 [Oscillatoria princeps RMCB-10]|nr:hypothetical protein [Oscillatoria princeps RMCB-10]
MEIFFNKRGAQESGDRTHRQAGWLAGKFCRQQAAEGLKSNRKDENIDRRARRGRGEAEGFEI